MSKLEKYSNNSGLESFKDTVSTVALVGAGGVLAYFFLGGLVSFVFGIVLQVALFVTLITIFGWALFRKVMK